MLQPRPAVGDTASSARGAFGRRRPLSAVAVLAAVWAGGVGASGGRLRLSDPLSALPLGGAGQHVGFVIGITCVAWTFLAAIRRGVPDSRTHRATAALGVILTLLVVALPIDCIPSQRACRSIVSNLGASTNGRVHWIAAGMLLLLAGAGAITVRPPTGARIALCIAMVVAGWCSLVGWGGDLPPSAVAQLTFLMLCALMLDGPPAGGRRR